MENNAMTGENPLRRAFNRARPPAIVPDIVHLTYREDLGPTGGPGGVLHVAKHLLSFQAEGLKFAYHFKEPALPVNIPHMM